MKILGVRALAALVLERRRQLRMSQRQVAERAGCSHTMVLHVETGDRKLSAHNLLAILDALELEMTIAPREHAS